MNTTTRSETNLPYVHLILNSKDGEGVEGHMVRDWWLNPKIRNTASKFKLIPLSEIKDEGEGQWRPAEIQEPILNRPDFFEQLREGWKYVSIKTEDGKYISCRRGTNIGYGWTALCVYRERIGDFERWEVLYHPGTGYSFKSHNGLYLHANYKMWTVAGRPAPPPHYDASRMSWRVSPILHSSTDEVRVEFVGVYNKTNASFEMSLPAEGGNLAAGYWEGRQSLYYQGEELMRSGITLCHDVDDDLWYYFLRVGDIFYMVVTRGTIHLHETQQNSRSRFSTYLAILCVGELRGIHEFFRNERDHTYKGRDARIRADLSLLMDRFYWEGKKHDEELMASVASTTMLMDQNIQAIHANIGTAEDIQQMSTELVDEIKVFKKRAKALRQGEAMRWAAYSVALVGVVGASAAFCQNGAGATAPASANDVESMVYLIGQQYITREVADGIRDAIEKIRTPGGPDNGEGGSSGEGPASDGSKEAVQEAGVGADTRQEAAAGEEVLEGVEAVEEAIRAIEAAAPDLGLGDSILDVFGYIHW